MRTALGARRGRLVRQMLTESLALAAAGGIAGLAVAALCHRGLLALVGDRIPVPRLDQMALDWPVIAFTIRHRAGDRRAVRARARVARDEHAERWASRRADGATAAAAAPGVSTMVIAEVALALMLLAAPVS